MPDLNSVPPSPHIRASSQMPPPPVPGSLSLNILPSHQNAVNHPPSLPSPQLPSSLASPTAAAGPIPIRHPRPMTAADLHLQLEKEQEAAVNRLSRELSLLRSAQNASVASNASSTSATASGSESVAADAHPLSSSSGFSHPLAASSRRHHRTSSNSSSRSLTATNPHPASLSASSLAGGISSPAPARPGNPINLSRQNSTASRRSRASSPTPYGSHHHHGALPHQIDTSVLSAPYRNAPTPVSLVAAPGSAVSASDFSPGVLPGTPRYEETAHYRAELDGVKRENEVLKRRVRDLERQIRGRRPSDAGRTGTQPSDDNKTEGGSRAAEQPGEAGTAVAAGSMNVGIPGDTIRVGESAASRVRE